ncbi:hypothetical protein SODALDRAFT_331366 [Sodiomyces alkalinus F11]|uniref:Brl1/Brr6 domain-containing protein n=1 Tax=Sodiomyces alkalinus (strain CBS 110278 / VKM F-3762 / F11) TaxID=1314773 RepID=A0A3N2Q4C2_SODAK|nr:hypothetical protein SODALDRAFT_331366 [Sodiomyces alkalinus F11]ROT41609.1 hypothetical protein SODALDRAFT_331366 [Sodiomyces alkalinus F11]
MERRTYEGPMEWEYHDGGPLDATSPFSQVAKSHAPSNVFSTPSKFGSRPNPFANTPSRTLPHPPQTSSFSPRIQSGNTAPPFRNPAFTTPRKPFDESVFSEAESSPALTETPDLGNDTPEVDRLNDMHLGTITPSRVDKNLRYGKSVAHPKRYQSGKGEIPRGSRDYAALRKRRRHNNDRDVGSLRYHSSRDDSESESDGEDVEGVPRPSQRRSRKEGRGKVKGWFDTVVEMINHNPNMPDNLSKWIALLVNMFVIAVFVYFGWSLVSTVRSDINNANEAARREIITRALECNDQYILNECAKKDRPALKAMCDEWDECRIQDPESIMVVKNTAKQVAEVINEFAGTMTMHAWAFFFGLLLLCLAMNTLTGGVSAGTGIKPTNPVPSKSVPEAGAPQPSGFPGDVSQAYMWVPLQTPRRLQQVDFDDDDATDTDGASPQQRKTTLPAPQTPSRRQSPNKGDRVRSPMKLGPTPRGF